jgi:predicted kinase
MVEAMTGTRVLPISRRVEYASKLVAPSRVPLTELSGVSPREHRNANLAAGGAREAFVATVLDRPEIVEREIGSGSVVLVDARTLSTEELSALRARFKTEGVATGVLRLEAQR